MTGTVHLGGGGFGTGGGAPRRGAMAGTRGVAVARCRRGRRLSYGGSSYGGLSYGGLLYGGLSCGGSSCGGLPCGGEGR